MSDVETLRDVILAASAPRVVGIEREYTVHDSHGVIDARPMWSTLRSLGAAIDPGDANARRGPWGGAVTLDGAEVEVATPPVPLRPGVTGRLLASAAEGQRHLDERLPEGHRLVGYSTHLNVEVDDRLARPLARFIAARLAVPLMLLVDRRHSPGILVRPRHGRVEIGGEFLAGRQLRSATVLSIATVLLGERALADRSLRRALRANPKLVPARAVERYGWFADRHGFGCDLYAAGRDAQLVDRRARVEARAVLAGTWDLARPTVERIVDQHELALVDRQVDGRDPLPLELPIDADVDDVWSDVAPAPNSAKRSYGARERDGLTVTVFAATWWRAVIELESGQRTRWLTIPGRALDAVLCALDEGWLWTELATLTR